MTVDESRLIRERRNGAKAEALFEGLEEIFTELEEDYRNGWRNSMADEHVRREEIYRSMRNLEALKQKIKTRIATGKAAVTQLEKSK